MGLFEKKINQFPRTLEWATRQDVEPLRWFIASGCGTGLLFVGSGGSYTAAVMGEMLSAGSGRMSRAVTPYVFAWSGLSGVGARTLLISASGGNNDICRAYEAARVSGAEVGALTLSRGGRLRDMFRADCNPALMACDMPGGSDGFLSSNRVVALCVLLARAFGVEGLGDMDCMPGKEELERIEAYAAGLNISNDTFSGNPGGVDSYIVLYSAATLAAAVDLESKFYEGAIGNIMLSDYRNFAHGRFNWLTQRPGQTAIIALQTPSDRLLAEETIALLPPEVPVLRLASSISSPVGAVSLIIKGHFLCAALASRWGLDLARPSIPPYGHRLYTL